MMLVDLIPAVVGMLFLTELLSENATDLLPGWVVL